MSDVHWTPSLVEAWIIEAADVLSRLPNTRVRGFITSWPPIVRDFCEAYGWQDAVLRRPPPPADAIDRMDKALQWLGWLEQRDTRIVWLRAQGKPWKAVCWEVGLARAAAHQHWMFALCVIAWRLNGKKVSRHVSKRSLIAATRQEKSNDHDQRPQRDAGQPSSASHSQKAGNARLLGIPAPAGAIDTIRSDPPYSGRER